MNYERRRLATLRRLSAHPRRSRAELRAFQDEQLRRLVRHAHAKVPFYRRLFDQHGLDPASIRGVQDLSRIPITSRRDRMAQPLEDLIAEGVDPARLVGGRTSGSTGEPVEIRREPREARMLSLLRLRALRGYGLRAWTRGALLLASAPGRMGGPLRRLARRLRLGVLWIPCLQEPAEILAELRRFRPVAIGGLSGVIDRVAQEMSEEDRRLLRPRWVLVGGEVLTEAMRSRIGEAFGARVLDMYGSWEFDLLAWECEETGEYHVCDDGLLLEVEGDSGPAPAGEKGEVIGTGLHSFAMPFIRYRTGDLVVRGAEACACGRPFSTIRSIEGRVVDYFPLPDGRRLHPYEILRPLVIDFDWLRRHHLLQESLDRIVLRAEAKRPPTEQELASLRAKVRPLLGEGVAFDVEIVDEIRPEPSGKYRPSWSRVAPSEEA